VSVWQLPAWLDGRMITSGEPAVALSDLGFRSGVGVFETLRVEDARVLALPQHLERLRDGAARLGIDVAPDALTAALTQVLTAARRGTDVDLVARITVTAGPLEATANWPPRPSTATTVAITLHVAPSLPVPPAQAVRVAGRRWPADVKSTSYLASVLATREARDRGADVGVLCDGDELLEGAEGNLLLIGDGVLCTPPADGRILAGVTRGLVLEVARAAGLQVIEGPVHLRDALRARTLLTTSAVQRIRVLSSLDGTVLPGDGPTVELLRQRLAALAGASEPLPLG
jgi:branched-subunit amino acid aminotransferase/4-amino-4-deoxychorismate lyase